jgi:O-acetyl-ADP-ribose deacetylase (regulator of RNase III)
MAELVGATSISYPSISTGIYGYPLKLASKTAIDTVVQCLPSYAVKEVHFVLFTQRDYNTYQGILSKKKLV